MAIFYQPPEPRQAYPKVLPQTQGASPKPAGPLGGSVNALTAVGVWATLAAVPMPVQKPLNVVPLTLKYGSQPAPQPPLTLPEQTIARVWWPEANEPRLQWNDQQPERRYVVAQTLRYGSQPAPQAPLSAIQQNVAVRWWDLPQQAPPSLIGVAAIKGVPAIPAFVPFNPTNPAIGLWLQPDWRAQSEPEIAPLTLPRGDSVPFARQPSATTPVNWPTQSAPGSAAWNIPVVVSAVVLGGNRTPGWIYDWWTTPVLDIQYSGSFVAQNAPADQPPVEGALPVVDIAVLRAAWEPARQEPPRPVGIAPLTLARGDVVPFSRPPVFWTPLDWPSQSEESNAGWNFVPPVVSQPTPYVRFQSHLLAAAIYWPSQSEADNAAWNVPVIVSQPIPYVRLRHHLLVAGPWWGAQSYAPNAAWNFISLAIARAIAQSVGTDSIVASSQASGTLNQNSGIIAINTADSQTIQIITGNSGVISLDSDG